MKKKPKKVVSHEAIDEYDTVDTTAFIDKSKPLKLEDIGIALPPSPPTQVVSIRIPTQLLNELRALGSMNDVPYQALIKLILNEGVQKMKKRRA